MFKVDYYWGSFSYLRLITGWSYELFNRHNISFKEENVLWDKIEKYFK